MERRAFERVPANIDARLFYGSMFYKGIVVNLSESGMFVSTDKCLPADSGFLLIFKNKDQLLKMKAKVRRVSKINGNYHGMGVELLHLPDKYYEFVNSLKSSLINV